MNFMDSGMESTHFNSMFDQVIITNEGTWQGYMTQVSKVISERSATHNTFFLCDRLSVFDVVHD